MADVTLSQICSSLDGATLTCRLNGQKCPYANGHYPSCGDSTFAARVSMPPDEFVVLLNSQNEPALGTLAVIKCRRPEFHLAAAGVHVNVILESPGDGSLLEATWQIDGGVEFFCPASEVRFIWRNGKFIPA